MYDYQSDYEMAIQSVIDGWREKPATITDEDRRWPTDFLSDEWIKKYCAKFPSNPQTIRDILRICSEPEHSGRDRPQKGRQ